MSSKSAPATKAGLPSSNKGYTFAPSSRSSSFDWQSAYREESGDAEEEEDDFFSVVSEASLSPTEKAEEENNHLQEPNLPLSVHKMEEISTNPTSRRRSSSTKKGRPEKSSSKSGASAKARPFSKNERASSTSSSIGEYSKSKVGSAASFTLEDVSSSSTSLGKPKTTATKTSKRTSWRQQQQPEQRSLPDDVEMNTSLRKLNKENFDRLSKVFKHPNSLQTLEVLSHTPKSSPPGSVSTANNSKTTGSSTQSSKGKVMKLPKNKQSNKKDLPPKGKTHSHHHPNHSQREGKHHDGAKRAKGNGDTLPDPPGTSSGSDTGGERLVMPAPEDNDDDVVEYKTSLMDSLMNDMNRKSNITATQKKTTHDNNNKSQRKHKHHGTANNSNTVDPGDHKVPAKQQRKRTSSAKKKKSSKALQRESLAKAEGPREVSPRSQKNKRETVVVKDPENPDESGLTLATLSASFKRASDISVHSTLSDLVVDAPDKNDDARAKWCRWFIILWIVVFVVIISAAVVTLSLVLYNNDSDDQSSTMTPTGSGFPIYYADLPEYTQVQLDDPSTPQAQAYYWLHDKDDRSALSTQHALQQFALATFFYATRGDIAWDDASSWLDYAKPECSWYSTMFDSVCDAAQRYHTLALANNGLQGSIPEELELLSVLSIVHLEDNQITGALPKRIWSSWQYLVLLDLSDNLLTGTLPAEVSHLSTAKYLNTLNLGSNKLIGTIPSQVGLLPLKFLSLSRNNLTGTLPPEVGDMTDARAIYLHSNMLRGTIPSSLGQLTKLTRLELHNNDLDGSVPDVVCDLVRYGNLKDLTVDCSEVRCDCGCNCNATM